MTKKPLVTIIILHYNQMDYIKTAILSVLEQDYSFIELIVADDNSSQFDALEVDLILKEFNKENSVKYQILTSNENVGTIKNINRSLKMSNGEYILIFAADDKLSSKDAISSMINQFDISDNELITAQVDMKDIKLEKHTSFFVDEETILKTNNSSPSQQREMLFYKSRYAIGSTMFKKQCFEKFGYFNEKYKVVEDWTYFLEFTKKGGRVKYFDKVILDHRAGGISENKKITDFSKSFLDDLNVLYVSEILPNIKSISDRKIRIEILSHYKAISNSKILLIKVILTNLDFLKHNIIKIVNKIKYKSKER